MGEVFDTFNTDEAAALKLHFQTGASGLEE